LVGLDFNTPTQTCLALERNPVGFARTATGAIPASRVGVMITRASTTLPRRQSSNYNPERKALVEIRLMGNA